MKTMIEPSYAARENANQMRDVYCAYRLSGFSRVQSTLFLLAAVSRDTYIVEDDD